MHALDYNIEPNGQMGPYGVSLLVALPALCYCDHKCDSWAFCLGLRLDLQFIINGRKNVYQGIFPWGVTVLLKIVSKFCWTNKKN